MVANMGLRSVAIAQGRLQVSDDPTRLIGYLLEFLLGRTEGRPPEQLLAPTGPGLAYRDQIGAGRVTKRASLPPAESALWDAGQGEVWRIMRYGVSTDAVYVTGDDLRQLLKAATPLWAGRVGAPSELLPFPIGATAGHGRYRIEQTLLGSPGWGIYRARDTENVDRLLSLAFPHTISYAEMGAELRLPIQGIAPLRHLGPLDCSYYGQAFDVLVEDLPDGVPSTSVTLDSASLPRVALALARVLEQAHAKGLLLGELQPELIYVSQDNTGLRLSGIAPRSPRFFATMKAHHGARAAFADSYVAPEVDLGAAPSAKSDVFSLCAVIFKWVSGEHPFIGSSQAAAQPRRRPFSESTAFGKVIDRGLDTNPDRRASLAEVIAALET